MAEQLAEYEAIANSAEAPTFENTIVAMEKGGRTLARTSRVFFNLVGADTNDARKQLQTDYAPRLAAHQDSIYLNPKLFARVQKLFDTRNDLGLDAEGVRLVERYHDDFVRAGARLSDADTARLK
jgi:peptidyl-dipeptidase Dcp